MTSDKVAYSVFDEDLKNGGLTNDIKNRTHFYWWFLKSIGIWPPAKTISLTFPKILPKIQVVLNCCFLGVSLIPCLLHILFEEKDITIQVKSFGPMSYSLVTVSKYFSLISKNKSIQKCFDHINEDWRNIKNYEDRRIMLKNAEFGRYLTLIGAVFMSSGTIFYYAIMPLTIGTITNECNITVRPLGHPTYDKLWNARESPIYETVFFIELLASLVLNLVTISTLGLTALFTNHACGQLQIVMSWLEDLVNGDRTFGVSRAERLAIRVRQHLRVLNFIKFVEHLLRDIFVMEFVVCTLNMCLLGYYFVTEFQSTATINIVCYCILFTSMTFNIFIFCYMGDLLSEQCRKVGSTSYMIDWYRLPGKSALGLILISKMSNSSQKLTAGKVVELSLSTFTNVVKIAMAYLNVLRNVVK